MASGELGRVGGLCKDCLEGEWKVVTMQYTKMRYYKMMLSMPCVDSSPRSFPQ
jgi:hypothetical protein